MPATSAAVCDSPNAADGPDYSGEVQATAAIRMSDHDSSGGEATTLIDIPFPLRAVECANTSSTSEGAICTVTTTANAVVAGVLKPGKRTIWEVGQVVLYDGGAGGDIQTPDGGPLVKEGVFAP